MSPLTQPKLIHTTLYFIAVIIRQGPNLRHCAHATQGKYSMGVNNLWELLEPAAKTVPITSLALQDRYVGPAPHLPYVIGVDTSPRVIPLPDLTLVILVILAFPFALYLSLQQSQYIWPNPFADEAYPCSVPPPD
ncbi:uncharacterized protein EDB93DRAFT_1255735 [Suillus bovinus]|uniref:uncharacterized protein n=1 Tax=Suillus bovinus TaxID=48563 RepID=UPI001B886156|nr:uncharacterized protein EDB93DRAFT_1255735 [Suillus bovinus]KAG2130840.1 hypothetical protein EDB93DRAFT_1255735 [Suillus bovinus]